jgi:hypothetical protein
MNGAGRVGWLFWPSTRTDTVKHHPGRVERKGMARVGFDIIQQRLLFLALSLASRASSAYFGCHPPAE